MRIVPLRLRHAGRAPLPERHVRALSRQPGMPHHLRGALRGHPRGGSDRRRVYVERCCIMLSEPFCDAGKGLGCYALAVSGYMAVNKGTQAAPVSQFTWPNSIPAGPMAMVPYTMGSWKRRGPIEPGLKMASAPSRAMSGR